MYLFIFWFGLLVIVYLASFVYRLDCSGFPVGLLCAWWFRLGSWGCCAWCAFVVYVWLACGLVMCFRIWLLSLSCLRVILANSLFVAVCCAGFGLFWICC